MSHYDALVIGGGQGGDPIARAMAKAGRKTAVVDRSAYLGGTCVNWGCTPSKTMAASAQVADLARRAAEFGVECGPVRVDMARVRERKQRVVDAARSGLRRTYAALEHLELIHGEARFTGPKRVEVHVLPSEGSSQSAGETRALTADLIFIDTGQRPFLPPLEGLSSTPFLDSTSIMELDVAPEHLLILGGGDVAVEFAQMFRRFGSRVTIVERGRQLLAREDTDVAEAMAEILREDGVEVRLGSEALAVRTAPDGVELKARDSGSAAAPHGITGSHLLVAAGRTPNTDALNLADAGVETDDRGYIRVNGRLETTAPGVYAIGDVKGGPAFTHVSYDDFRILEANLLRGGQATTAGRIVPYTIFSDPQLGRVGLTERTARAQDHDVRVATLPMAETARGVETGETRGFMKAVVDRGTGRILGAAILSANGGEVMAVVQVAMMARLPYAALRDGMFAHPTLAESLNNLFMAMEG